MRTGVSRVMNPSWSWVASWVVSRRHSLPTRQRKLLQANFYGCCRALCLCAATEKNAGMILLTVAMVLLTGALETIMWIFGFAAMIIAAHAATHVPAVQSGAEPQQLDNVV